MLVFQNFAAPNIEQRDEISNLQQEYENLRDKYANMPVEAVYSNEFQNLIMDSKIDDRIPKLSFLKNFQADFLEDITNVVAVGPPHVDEQKAKEIMLEIGIISKNLDIPASMVMSVWYTEDVQRCEDFRQRAEKIKDISDVLIGKCGMESFQRMSPRVLSNIYNSDKNKSKVLYASTDERFKRAYFFSHTEDADWNAASETQQHRNMLENLVDHGYSIQYYQNVDDHRWDEITDEVLSEHEPLIITDGHGEQQSTTLRTVGLLEAIFSGSDKSRVQTSDVEKFGDGGNKNTATFVMMSCNNAAGDNAYENTNITARYVPDYRGEGAYEDILKDPQQRPGFALVHLKEKGFRVEGSDGIVHVGQAGFSVHTNMIRVGPKENIEGGMSWASRKSMGGGDLNEFYQESFVKCKEDIIQSAGYALRSMFSREKADRMLMEFEQGLDRSLGEEKEALIPKAREQFMHVVGFGETAEQMNMAAAQMFSQDLSAIEGSLMVIGEPSHSRKKSMLSVNRELNEHIAEDMSNMFGVDVKYKVFFDWEADRDLFIDDIEEFKNSIPMDDGGYELHNKITDMELKLFEPETEQQAREWFKDYAYANRGKNSLLGSYFRKKRGLQYHQQGREDAYNISCDPDVNMHKQEDNSFLVSGTISLQINERVDADVSQMISEKIEEENHNVTITQIQDNEDGSYCLDFVAYTDKVASKKQFGNDGIFNMDFDGYTIVKVDADSFEDTKIREPSEEPDNNMRAVGRMKNAVVLAPNKTATFERLEFNPKSGDVINAVFQPGGNTLPKEDKWNFEQYSWNQLVNNEPVPDYPHIPDLPSEKMEMDMRPSSTLEGKNFEIGEDRFSDRERKYIAKSASGLLVGIGPETVEGVMGILDNPEHSAEKVWNNVKEITQTNPIEEGESEAEYLRRLINIAREDGELSYLFEGGYEQDKLIRKDLEYKFREQAFGEDPLLYFEKAGDFANEYVTGGSKIAAQNLAVMLHEGVQKGLREADNIFSIKNIGINQKGYLATVDLRTGYSPKFDIMGMPIQLKDVVATSMTLSLGINKPFLTDRASAAQLFGKCRVDADLGYLMPTAIDPLTGAKSLTLSANADIGGQNYNFSNPLSLPQGVGGVPIGTMKAYTAIRGVKWSGSANFFGEVGMETRLSVGKTLEFLMPDEAQREAFLRKAPEFGNQEMINSLVIRTGVEIMMPSMESMLLEGYARNNPGVFDGIDPQKMGITLRVPKLDVTDNLYLKGNFGAEWQRFRPDAPYIFSADFMTGIGVEGYLGNVPISIDVEYSTKTAEPEVLGEPASLYDKEIRIGIKARLP